MSEPPYDAIVIGSGAGGASAAYRLVLGGLRASPSSKRAVNCRPMAARCDMRRVVHGRRIPEPRGLARRTWPPADAGRALQRRWQDQVVRRSAPALSRSTNSRPTKHTAVAWPLSRDELAPYYAEAEGLLGVRTFPCEADLSADSRCAGYRGSPWQAQPIPLALAADISANPLEATHFDGFALGAQLQRRGRCSRCLRHCALDRTSPCSSTRKSPRCCRFIVLAAHDWRRRLADGRELHASPVILAAGSTAFPAAARAVYDASGTRCNACRPLCTSAATSSCIC